MAQPSASWLTGGFVQYQITPRSAWSLGQPRRLGLSASVAHTPDTRLTLASHRSRFDSSYERLEAPALLSKAGEQLPGWSEALLLMREGDAWELTLPPELAHGAEVSGPPTLTLTLTLNLSPSPSPSPSLTLSLTRILTSLTVRSRPTASSSTSSSCSR